MYNRHLIEYLPEFLRNVREYKAILTDGVEPEIVVLFRAIEDALNNQFIQDADEYGVQRWENILGITYKSDYTLDERKFAILTKINEQLPYTTRSMEKRLESLCGKDNYSVNVDVNNFTVNIGVALTARNSYNDVYAMLEEVVPANMVINLYLIYEQNKNWYGYTHEQLKAYTHNELRNGVY